MIIISITNRVAKKQALLKCLKYNILIIVTRQLWFFKIKEIISLRYLASISENFVKKVSLVFCSLNRY